MLPHSNTIKIQLLHGKVALIDASDYDLISGYKWLSWFSGTNWYVVAHTPRPSRTMVYMHRLITGAPKGQRVDHKDGDGMNNRRKNLRFATNQQNCFNSRLSKNNTSGYKGVAVSRGGRWQAGIKINYKRIALGDFDTPEEAARAYDAKARELFGDFAWTNF